MTPLADDELRAVLLGVLDELDVFCREHAIPYVLYAGTLLGAVRHGGFIPWDDDIDVMMARDDYERFLEAFSAHPVPALELVTHDSHRSYPYASAKVARTGTLVIEEVDIAETDRFGVSVDVLPYDVVSDRAWVFRLHVWLAWAVRAALLLKVVQGSANRPWRVRLVLAVTRLLLRPVPVHALVGARERIAELWRHRSTGHRSMLVASAPWRVPVAWIEPPTTTLFEERDLPVPADVDSFLRAVYGDYLRPPAEADRVAPHLATAYRLEMTA